MSTRPHAQQWPKPFPLNRPPRLGTAGWLKLRESTEAIKLITFNSGLIAAGCALYVIGVQGLLAPHGFLNGGVFGVCLIIHYLTPGLGLGFLNLLLNLPLLLLGWFNLSRRFMLFTLFGISGFSVLLDAFNINPFPVQDKMLAGILAGLICGAGCGLILKSAGSAGGLDILSIYLLKKYDIRPGLTSLIANILILAAGALIFNLEMALYTLIFVFTQSKVMDAVIFGFNQRKTVMIVSERSQEIAEAIMNHLHRGVTFLHGSGGYTGQEKRVILSVVTPLEMAKMKELALTIDPTAFLIINNTLDVIGSSLNGRRGYSSNQGSAARSAE